MEFRVLGPLQVRAGSAEIHLSGQRQRQVLAVLLLNANRVVTLASLVDAVWDDEPPASAKRQVQNCVSSLRSEFIRGGVRRPVVVGDGRGYRVRLENGELDAELFDARIAAARAAPTEAATAEELRSALRLWRGPAFADVAGIVVEAAAARLNEQRLAVTEWCVDIELQLGRHHELIGELTELAATHPLRERLVGQLMTALHRAGRRSDALRVYRLTCERLADELGLDPSAPLRRLQTAILRDESPASVTAGRPGSDAKPATGPAVVPRQLPAVTGQFVGRSDTLAALDRHAEAAGPGVVISALVGAAGVGKTTTAVYWAHRSARRFPDGQLYVNLRGFHPRLPPVTAEEAVRGFLDALGVAPERIPAGLEAQLALYRSLLAGRHMLVLLDNARDADQARPLLPGAPTCTAVVTSRDRLTGLVACDGAQPVVLNLLPAADARDLLIRRLGPEPVAADPAAVTEIVRLCGGLPLALVIVAARAATQPECGLNVLSAQLRDASGPLGALDTGDPSGDVRAVLSWTYRCLSAGAARLFRLLSLHPGPDITVAAAASLCAAPPAAVRPTLDELAGVHLAGEHRPGRFVMHDLVRAYAHELCVGHDGADDRRTAVLRVLDHYLHTAHTADRLEDPHRQRIALDPPHPGVQPEDQVDAGAAMNWFAAERPVLFAIVHQATSAGFDEYTWRLAWTLADYLERGSYWHEWVLVMRAGYEAALRLRDPAAQAHTSRGLGRAYARLGCHDDARTHLGWALGLYREVGDVAGQAHTELNLGWLYGMQHQDALALDHARRAHLLYETTGHLAGQARALNAVGWYHTRLGDHRSALAYCERAVRLSQEIADPFGEAHTWDSLGRVHHHLGDADQATDCYRRAIALYRDAGDRYNEADTLLSLGDTRLAAGDGEGAQHAWRSALSIFTDLGHADADQARARLRAP